MPIPVRATALGFYDGGRRRPGDVFEVRSESELGSWMERLPQPTESAPPAKGKAKDKQ